MNNIHTAWVLKHENKFAKLTLNNDGTGIAIEFVENICFASFFPAFILACCSMNRCSNENDLKLEIQEIRLEEINGKEKE